jgi:PTS system mannose-specific IIA component
MIGIVIVTHSGLGEALIDAAECVLDAPLEATTAVSVDLKHSADQMRAKIVAGIKAVDQGDGVIILTDMFGGTPSNLSLSFLEEGRIDVLTGVNLPVLIRAEKMRKDNDLGVLAENIQVYGKKSISLASGVLKGNKKSRA